ncbi:MAG TPA: DUF2252 domain-containing protein [Burkholderiaceae bacterium]|nr:DUF2252 domain-containing protein [Burkholderiaceae bacterium]
MNRRRPIRHVVLAGADSQGYHSLRHQSVSRAERLKIGRNLRDKVPRQALANWKLPVNRPDPVELIKRSHEGRLPWLIPVRVARMKASPHAFLRGSANVMAWDVAHLPATGIMPVVCGDAHLGNFGFYASPERDLIFDLNDFDEAHPGCWEWDLRRLTASIWVTGRDSGSTEVQCQDAVAACVAAYRHELRSLANEPLLWRSYQRLDIDRLRETVTEQGFRNVIERAVRRARTRTSDRALPRFTTEQAGERRIVEEPPLITRVPAAAAERIAESLDQYLNTLALHWRRAVAGYTLVDIAHKVVGVGSVGLRAYVALLEGSSPDDVLFLQLKQARRSVLAPYVHGDSAWHAHQGQRVVEYQQALQTVSDPLLGWTTIEGLQYYVRQFRDMKGSIPLDAMDAAALRDYGGIVGHLLAKGHARTSGASMIAGYVGMSDKLDKALCHFARAYADQTEADHRALLRAVARGDLPDEPVEPGPARKQTGVKVRPSSAPTGVRPSGGKR